eukprot:5097956-Pyramimonas_sp.AAC.1
MAGHRRRRGGRRRVGGVPRGVHWVGDVSALPAGGGRRPRVGEALPSAAGVGGRGELSSHHLPDRFEHLAGGCRLERVA